MNPLWGLKRSVARTTEANRCGSQKHESSLGIETIPITPDFKLVVVPKSMNPLWGLKLNTKHPPINIVSSQKHESSLGIETV